MADKYFDQIRNQFSKNRFLKHGLPFILLVVGGSFALENLTRLRYEFRQRKEVDFETAEKELGIKIKKKETPVSIESLHEEMKQKDLDSWQNIRGPRPWESSKDIQEELRKGTKV
ncbi:hypothetical protein SNE40_010572 [Patella caerulea]|uniref:Cytochrome c oxidase assembly protein COX16 homolog, mitochondrial n=1 Tax=Patella caerulea TaxID=87958 RepID=A0AAN8JQS0_PATCE